MTTLVLVRHGQASFGAHNYDVLSQVGERQGTLLGDHWRELKPDFDAAYCGAMVRQRHTGEQVLHALGRREVPIHERAAFNEYDADKVVRAYLPLVAKEHPDFSMDKRQLFADRKHFQRFFEKVIACWTANRPHSVPGLESWTEFCERCVQGLREVATPESKRVVVFTSGGVITAALRQALKLDDETSFRMNWRIYNASVHHFHVGRSGLSLMGFNDIAHLELAREPTLLTFR